MKHYIVIADVHGALDNLIHAIRESERFMIAHLGLSADLFDGLDHDGNSVQWIFLGDYIDRGPNSKEVLAIVKKYVLEKNAICLLGNHDMFLIGTVDGTDVDFGNGNVYSNADLWDNNGGLKTCVEMFGRLSIGPHFEDAKSVMDYKDKISKSEEYAFLKEHGKLKHATTNLFFSHAPQSEAKEYNDSTLIWGRNSDYSKTDQIFKVSDNKLMSVHGHFHRLTEKVNFPRFVDYTHGGIKRTVILADCGCGCGWYGKLHPVIITEGAEIVAVL